MVTDSVANASSVSSVPSAGRDFGKKKRANRSAKLKQCKLDARREQWLSQVKNKVRKEAWDDDQGRRNRNCRSPDNMNMTRTEGEDNDGLTHHETYSESPSDSPISLTGVFSNCDSGCNYTGSSSSSSAGCCSGSITEEEEEAEDGCLDDWEAMADALAANDNRPDQPFKQEPVVGGSHSSGVVTNGSERSRTGCLRMGQKVSVVSSQAWRADDAFRPQSLPNLSKQHHFTNSDWRCGNGGSPWGYKGVLTAPASCPICCEDLDLTDSSFLPCLCGFRLCLFCHKRILEEDSRCPGCRRPYDRDTPKAEGSILGACPAFH